MPLHKSIMQPHMEYQGQLWSLNPKKDIADMEKLQKEGMKTAIQTGL